MYLVEERFIWEDNPENDVPLATLLHQIQATDHCISGTVEHCFRVGNQLVTTLLLIDSIITALVKQSADFLHSYSDNEDSLLTPRTGYV